MLYLLSRFATRAIMYAACAAAVAGLFHVAEEFRRIRSTNRHSLGLLRDTQSRHARRLEQLRSPAPQRPTREL
jgi:hypothetical protein